MNVKLKLRNGKRFACFILSCICILLIVLIITHFHAAETTSFHSSYEKYTVLPGDTYWSIAQRYIKHGDIREYIYTIEKLNDIPAGELHPGDTLNIPIQ